MNKPPAFQVDFMEDGSAEVRARICTSTNNSTDPIIGEGYAAKQANLTSITYAVFNLTTGDTTATSSGTVTIASAVYDTLQESPVWSGEKGFNFLHVVPPAAFPTGGHKYVVEYKVTYSGGAVGWVICEGQARGVLTS